jgi:hypothetical protein
MSSAACYWPGGSVAGSNLIPAESNESSGYAACCFTGHYFFANGLCLDINQITFYRGGCTDKTWASAACPRYCLSESTSQCGIWGCNNDNQFACSISDCGNQSLMFTVNGGTIRQNAALASALPTTTSTSTSTTQIASTSNATHSPTSAACPSHLGAYTGLGVGIGVPLLVSLLALMFVVLRLRSYKKAAGMNGNGAFDNHGHGPQAQSLLSSNDYHSGNHYSPPLSGRNQHGQPKAELPSAMSQYSTAELG